MAETCTQAANAVVNVEDQKRSQACLPRCKQFVYTIFNRWYAG